MRAPVHRLKKADIVWLGGHSCKHGHSYLEHYECYLKEHPEEGIRIGYLDIETTNLDANWGVCVCYCIKVHDKDKIYSRVITPKELRGKHLDKELCQQFLKDIQNFDKIVTYYGTRFDVPYIRTRCLINRLDFPEYGQLFHKDIYYIIRNKFKLNRSRQELACRMLLGETEKTHFGLDYWIRAAAGDKKALDYILDHCKRDVRDLNKLTNRVVNFHLPSNKSI